MSLNSFLDMGATTISLGLVFAIMTLGVHISYRILDMADLSIEGIFPLGCCVAGALIYAGVPSIFAALIAGFIGAGAGFITAKLHTGMKIPMILCGIIVMTGMYTVNLVTLGFTSPGFSTRASLNIPANVSMFNILTGPLELAGLTKAIAYSISSLSVAICCVAVVFVLIYYFFGTEIGMAIRATGDNQNMAKASGINTSKHIVIGLMISNGLVGLAGGLYAQYSGTASVNCGRGMIVVGLAAIIIGEAIFGRKSYKSQLISIIVGSILYYVLKNVALLLEVSEFLDLVSAVLVVVILAIPLIKSKVKTPIKKEA